MKIAWLGLDRLQQQVWVSQYKLGMNDRIVI